MSYEEFWQSLLPLYDEREAKAVTRTVMEQAFGLTLTDIYSGKINELSADERLRAEKICARLLTGQPVQYVLGVADFAGRAFRVTPAVLIPRPETAELCTLVTGREQAASGRPALLDVGTGSGCIAVTLALALPHSEVTAWDISGEALQVARDNARRLQASVRFSRQDALQPPADTALWDIIVSNPPYIAKEEAVLMDARVKHHEPATALFVPDDDPLLFYRAIARYAAPALRPGGRLYFEINPRFARRLERLMTDYGYRDIEVLRDFYGKERFLAARRPPVDTR